MATDSLGDTSGWSACHTITIVKHLIEITVYKETMGGDGEFDYDTDLGDFSIQTTAGNGTNVFSDIDPDLTYFIDELPEGGWKFESLWCSEGTITGDMVQLDPTDGQDIVCVWHNSKLIGITIEKEALGDNGEFDYTTTGGSSLPSSFSITTTGGFGSVYYDDIDPDLTYTIEELAEAGWKFEGLWCSEGSITGAKVTLNPTEGVNITCTYHNSKLGRIIIEKTTVGGDGTFYFTGNLGDFSIVTPAPGQKTFNGVDPDYTYDVTETNPAPTYDLTNLVCADPTGDTVTYLATGKAHIVLSPGETVTCTFTNTKRGTIIVEKQTLPDNSPAIFDFIGDAAGSISDGDTITVPDLMTGTYYSTESGKVHWDLISITCSDTDSSGDLGTKTATFNLAPGETVTCTFTNRQRGTIIVKKVTDPSGTDDLFTFASSWGVGFQLKGGETKDSDALVPGTYSVSEVGIPPEWDLTAKYCDNGDSPYSITLGAGQTITCTFENTKRGHIIVKKVVYGGNGDFTFDPSWGDDFTIQGGQQQDSGAQVPGGYSVHETGMPQDWDLTARYCDNGDSPYSITLGAGQTVTCTFENTKRGTITVVKQTIGGDSSFEFDPSWNTTDFHLSNGQSHMSPWLLPNQQYTVDELQKTGWDLTGIDCTGASDWSQNGYKLTVNLKPGERVTCTFENTKRGSILMAKKTVAGYGTFNFVGLGGFSLTTSITVNPASKLFENKVPGDYTVTEDALAGWDLSDITCTGGDVDTYKADRKVIIHLDAGEMITCAFTNTKSGKIVIEKQTMVRGGDAWFTWTMTGEGLPPTISFPTQNGFGSWTSDWLKPNQQYTITESPPLGWTLVDIRCRDANGNIVGSQVGTYGWSLNLPPNTVVTCRFRNARPPTVTDSSLCPFDMDQSRAGWQFRLHFMQDPTKPSTYMLKTSTPAQFYFHGFINGGTGTSASITLTIPYPFVTQGVSSIHVYDGFDIVNGCFVPGNDISSGYTFSRSQITLADYGAAPVLGFTTVNLVVSKSAPTTPVIYVNINLNYGLKNVLANIINDAYSNARDATTGRIVIPNFQNYSFAFSSGSYRDSQTIESMNKFKKNPGFAGQVLKKDTQTPPQYTIPVPGVLIRITRTSDHFFVGETTSVEDGFYFIAYKHTGKATLYRIQYDTNGNGMIDVYDKYVDVMVKSNTFVWTDLYYD
jgi:hypothetical protein